MHARVPLPGETAEGCRVRVFNSVRHEWRDMVPNDRARYTQMAKVSNHQEAAVRRLGQQQQLASVDTRGREPIEVVAAATQASSHALVKPAVQEARVDAVAPFAGLGAMGTGDKAHAISVGLIRRLEQEHKEQGKKQFVVTLDRAWRERNAGRTGEAPEFKQSTQMSCHEEFKCAMCSKDIKDGLLQEQISQQLLTFVSTYRRKFLVNKKNQGPNCMVQHPLLILRTGATELLVLGQGAVLRACMRRCLSIK